MRVSADEVGETLRSRDDDGVLFPFRPGQMDVPHLPGRRGIPVSGTGIELKVIVYGTVGPAQRAAFRQEGVAGARTCDGELPVVAVPLDLPGIYDLMPAGVPGKLFPQARSAMGLVPEKEKIVNSRPASGERSSMWLSSSENIESPFRLASGEISATAVSLILTEP